jgi:hypothetical protein
VFRLQMLQTLGSGIVVLMSELWTPPGSTPPGLRSQVSAPAENWEPYYSEVPKIEAVGQQLNQMFAWTGENPDTERRFESMARNLFGEIGFTIAIEWMQAMDPETGEELPFKAPSLQLTGRVVKEEQRDHDRLKHEVRAGLADGKAGVIDPNDPAGGLKEPKRKSIF